MDEPQEQQEMAPYVIEGARSSRSRCKTCRRSIDKGALRIGVLIEGPYGVGYLWHHLRCAARRQFERVEEAYGAEAWNAAKQPPPKVPLLEELAKLRDAAEQRKKTRKVVPYVEAAPTGRSKCKSCGEPIEQGRLRVVLGRGVQFGNQVRTAPINVHPGCVADELDNPECITESEGLAQALRANSTEVSPEQIDALLAELGDIG